MRVAVRSMFVVVVGASAALGRGAAADPAVATDAERPFSLVSVVGDVAIVTWDRASLERAAAGRKRFVVEQVPLAWDLHVDIALERFSVTGPTTRFVLGRRDGPDEPIDFDPSRIALFRGSVLGRAGSHVFLALSDTTSTGHVDLGPGAKRYYMSSKGRDGRDLGPGRLSVFAATGGSSMMPDVPLCGTSANGPVDAASGDPLAAALGGAGGPAAVSSPSGSATASSPGSAAPGAVGPGDGTVVPEPHGGPFDPGGGIVPVSLKQLELAVETDYEFFILFGDVDAAATYVVEMYAQVSDIYMRDVDTRVEVVFVRIWDDPDDLFNDPSPLSGFRSYWNENMGSVQRDAAQLFSGRRDYPFGGQAFLSALCTPSAYSVVGYAIGFFPDPAASSPYHYDIFVTAHELGHNAGTSHTHDGGNTIDTCNDPTTQPQRGSIMSYCQQTWSGGNANQDNYFHRLIQPAMDQHIGASACVVNDCNMNSVPDAADINIGNSADDNGNGIPDECEDCNENGVLDDADIAQGTSLDLNFNGVPDECEPDCNNNGVPDDRDIAIGTSVDLYGNDIPDECEADCNGNGVSDYTELQANMPLDIGRDVVLDACQDCDDDGVTDLNALAGGHGVWVASGLKASLVRLFHATTGVQMRESTGGSGSRVQEGQDVIVTSNGHVFVTSGADDRVLEFDAAGMYQGDFVSPGAGGLTFPTGLVLAPDGKLLVCSRGTDSVLAYSGADGTFLGPFVASGAGGLTQPFGLTFGPNGNLFVTSGTNEVIEYDGQDGSFVGVFVSSADNGGLKDPKGLAFKPDGNLLVASFGTNETLEYDGTSGASLGKWALAGTPDVLTQISPWGIRIGPNGNVYIVRTGEDFGSGDGGEHHDGSDNDSMRWSDLHLTNAQIYEFDVHNGNFVRAYVSGNDHDLQFPTGFAFVPRWEDDCNVNLVPDGCDITSGASEDLDGSGVPDECEVDCNGNGVFDRFDIIPLGTGLDCNFNGVPDECDVADGTSEDCNDDGRPDECGADCNGNGVLDLCDIADGTSEDCNGDGVPNECDADCNGNGEPDGCDIAGGGSSDCDDNGVPDECEPDCNNNGVADACDIAGGGSSDCDGNGVPDECDPDCNGNGAADACDIADGSSQDENHNGIPDECECFTTQLIKLTASDAAGGDNFGSAVAVSGDAAVVSSPLDGFAAGAAYVYRIDGGSATQEAKLTAPSPVPGDVFGTSVGIRGDVIVAGAPGDFVAGPQSGSAFVYRLIDGWSVETQLTASDAATGDFFGNGVAIGDGLIVVGAPGDNGLRGSAYVFRFDVRVGWVQEAKLTASDPTPEAFFGFVVAVRGDAIVVGAPGDADAGFQSGAAYVYRFNGSDWVQEMKLRAPDATAEDIFGVSVSVAGDMALVGAALAGNGSITSGAAYVYRFDGTAWNVEAKLLAPDAGDFDLFGWSASLGDDLALVGARLNDDGAMDAGAAYMFVFDGSNWIPRAKVTPSDPGFGDEFGVAVAATGDVAVVGAWLNNDAGQDSGSAYVYGSLADCNVNDTLDMCDIATGGSDDGDGDGVPDECEVISIIASDPPNDAIDARQPSEPDGSKPTGWASLEVVFDGDTSGLTPEDFTVTHMPPAPGPLVTITKVVPSGNAATLILSNAIPLVRWTIFTHDASGTSTRIGYLPADVGNDGVSNAGDVLALIDDLNGVVPPLADYQNDTDRSGMSNASDVLRVIDLLNGAEAYDVWNGASLPP